MAGQSRYRQLGTLLRHEKPGRTVRVPWNEFVIRDGAHTAVGREVTVELLIVTRRSTDYRLQDVTRWKTPRAAGGGLR